MQLDGWVGILAGSAISGLLAGAIAGLAGWIVAHRSGARVAAVFARKLLPPILWLGPATAMHLGLPVATDVGAERLALLEHLLQLAMILGVGWGMVSAVALLDEFVTERFPFEAEDNLEARRIHTRFRVLRRIVLVATIAVCGIAALMTFPGLRGLGAGLLASAGVLGIVLGIAARPTVETFLAGVQLAWTQPIRLDDVVIVEGEWGRIEEIHATYVVVRIWDLRRLVVPLGYFLSHPFQNWTRKSADLLGAVTVDVDYRTPVEAVRQRAGEILSESPRWNRGFWNLQVVEAGPTTLRLRVLLSAPNADVAWDLRCEVREKLIVFLQESYPECLPRTRAELVATTD